MHPLTLRTLLLVAAWRPAIAYGSLAPASLRNDDATFPGDGTFRPVLIRSGAAALVLAPGDATRYWTLLDLPPGFRRAAGAEELWLFGRGGGGPDASVGSHVRLWAGCAAELGPAPGGPPSMCPWQTRLGHAAILEPGGRDNHLTENVGHNAAAFWCCGGTNTSLYLIGGRYHRPKGDFGSWMDGVYLYGPAHDARSLRARAEDNAPSWWQVAQRTLQGTHAGCVEQRPWFKPSCEFDGKLSVTVFRGRVWLYVRANIVGEGLSGSDKGTFGGRYVQVTSASAKDFEVRGGRDIAWAPFQLLGILDYRIEPPASSDNIYFMSVNVNPVDSRTILALAPVLRDADDSGMPPGGGIAGAYVAMALSCDGVHFSALHPVVRATSAASHGRTDQHPVDGFVVRGELVYFWVHHNVPGIDMHIENAPAPSGPSRLMRYTMTRSALSKYTRRAMATLAIAGQCGGMVRWDDTQSVSMLAPGH
jgi:hypothetical protein